MTLPGDVPRPPAKRLPDTMVEAILSHLEQYDEATVRSAVQNALEVSRPVEVVDLWKRQEAATTYWILLLTGVNQEDEMRVAKDLLTWQAFFAKDSGSGAMCAEFGARCLPLLRKGVRGAQLSNAVLK
jgi:hypothetical protein